MSETEAQASARISPADNLDGWLSERTRDAEPEAPTGQESVAASPAEPTVAEPDASAQPAVDWREVVLPEDVPHGFFRGKKVGDLFESYKHAETAKQQAERERNELRQRLEALERERETEAVVRRVTGIGTQPAAPQQDPRDAEIDKLWFENPAEARRLLNEKWAEDARRVAKEEFANVREAEAVEQQTYAAQNAAREAVEKVAKDYGIAPEQAQARVMGAFSLLAAHATETGDNSIWTVPENYLRAVRMIAGDPTPAIQPPVVAIPAPSRLSDPPGSKRAATASRVPEPSPLAAEEEAVRREVARIAGVDPSRLIKREQQRR